MNRICPRPIYITILLLLLGAGELVYSQQCFGAIPSFQSIMGIKTPCYSWLHSRQVPWSHVTSIHLFSLIHSLPSPLSVPWARFLLLVFWGHTKNAQMTLLSLHSGIITSSAQRTRWIAKDHTQVGYVQGRHPTCYALAPFLIFLIFVFRSWPLAVLRYHLWL